ncbi:serine/threonine-protein kinase [Amycolatopsis speibonae]|uniref:non-specific serine/threonine protein kinase n=1 Tax=Amycolatopsis speibonae TaxID=1450224 RepID=A0ABV7NPZ5_9PSEU
MTQSAEPGHLVVGRYRLISKLGAGGFGRVWRARDETLDVDVAVKEVWLPTAITAAEHADRLRRAEREARNAARLRDNPSIVTVHDVVVENDIPWIVMQLVAGFSLDEHVRAHGPVPADRAIDIARALLLALGAAHDAGIVHRDVKPANVLLADTGEILLTDFGIAVHETDTTLTATGTLIGSVEYMAPERWDGGKAGAASDLFSLGATLYQGVEGNSPFHRDTPTAALAAILTYQVPPSQRAGSPLAGLIGDLLTKDPAQRPTVATVLTRLNTDTKAITPTPGPEPTKELTRPTPTAPDHGRNAAWFAGLMILFSLTVLGMIGISRVANGETDAFDNVGHLFGAMFFCGLSGSLLALNLVRHPLKSCWLAITIMLLAGAAATFAYAGLLTMLPGNWGRWSPIGAIVIIAGAAGGGSLMIEKADEKTVE